MVFIHYIVTDLGHNRCLHSRHCTNTRTKSRRRSIRRSHTVMMCILNPAKLKIAATQLSQIIIKYHFAVKIKRQQHPTHRSKTVYLFCIYTLPGGCYKLCQSNKTDQSVPDNKSVNTSMVCLSCVDGRLPIR